MQYCGKPGLLFLCQHNSLGPKLINGKIDLHLSHKFAKSQSPGCRDVNVISVFNQPFLLYIHAKNRWLVALPSKQKLVAEAKVQQSCNTIAKGNKNIF